MFWAVGYEDDPALERVLVGGCYEPHDGEYFCSDRRLGDGHIEQWVAQDDILVSGMWTSWSQTAAWPSI